jgi:hypothetical protein
MSIKEASILYRYVSVVVVSFYLVAVSLLLRFRKRVRPPFPLVESLVRNWFRPAYRGVLTGFSVEQGNCWIVGVPDVILSDRESCSRLVVLEDGRPLPMPHAAHDLIRSKGQGAYSHWGGVIYLSTSDNSDPCRNGRRYEVIEQKQ